MWCSESHLGSELERPEIEVSLAEVEAELVHVEVLEVASQVLLHPVAEELVPHRARTARRLRYPSHEQARPLSAYVWREGGY